MISLKKAAWDPFGIFGVAESFLVAALPAKWLHDRGEDMIPTIAGTPRGPWSDESAWARNRRAVTVTID